MASACSPTDESAVAERFDASGFTCPGSRDRDRTEERAVDFSQAYLARRREVDGIRWHNFLLFKKREN
jgi:hypothetical protein